MKKIMKDMKLSDAGIVKTDFFEDYAKRLKKNPDELESFKERMADEYNKTQDIALFLECLKIVAMAEGKISALAKAAKVERTSVYRMLSKENNPSFESVMLFTRTLGYKLSVSALK
jgi:probable addiction module antidote protein